MSRNSKRKRTWLSRLLNPVKYIELDHLEPDEKLFVIEVDETSPEVFQGLGIDEKRQKELMLLVETGFLTTNNTVAAAEVASKGARHANELFAISYMIAKRQIIGKNPLAALLGM